MAKNKLILPISILLGCVILSGAYYFSQKTKQKYAEQDRINRLETECREIGAKIYEAEDKNAGVSGGFSFDPQYKFNRKMNKCLYSGGVKMDNYWERYVKDALTNQKIINTVYVDTTIKLDAQGEKVISDFWTEHEILLNE